MKIICSVLLAVVVLFATVPYFHLEVAWGRELPESREQKGVPERRSEQDNSISSLKVPDTTVYDQNGKRLRFYTDLVKGRTVAINFNFTASTTIGPPLSATFRRVQMLLGERGRKDIQLISVSVDPTTDTPERMKAYAAKFKAGPGWTFVTGDKVEIDSLLKALGVAATDKNDSSPTILIGNDSVGYWTRAYGLASPAKLVEMIIAAANRSQVQRYEGDTKNN